MRLRTQLALLFFTLTFLTLVAAELLIFSTVTDIIRNQVTDQLRTVSSLKANRISALFQNNMDRVYLMTSRQNLLMDLRAYQYSNNKELLQTINKSLERTTNEVRNFEAIMIAGMDGKVISSTKTELQGMDISTQPVFRKAQRGEIVVDEFAVAAHQDLQLNLAGPLVLDGDSLGVIIIETDAENLERVLTDYKGLGESGETILIRRLNDDTIQYVSPLRFEKRELLRSYGKAENPDQLVYQDPGFHYNIKDYRGKEVIGIVNPLPDRAWVMLSKIDRSEALAPVYRTRNVFIVIGAIALLVASFISFLFGIRLSKPIMKLAGVAEQMSHGDFTRRAEINLKNEIGDLANAFNIMAERLEHLSAEDKRKVALLKSSNEALNHFAYVISHDLKAPIKNIEGLLPILEEAKVEEGKEEYYTVLEMMKRKTQDANDLIEGVLDYARLGSSGSLPKDRVDLNKLVSDTVATLNPPAHIKVEVQNDLPVVYFPKIPLKQIFQNLVGNAIKFMDKPHGKIEVGQESKGKFWKFWVRDNGPGIAEQDRDQIFGMFKFIKKKQEVESSGIGLGVVKKIITDNGGEIWVESEPGKGSVFYFTIPKGA